jgi:hypothetical protein
VKLPAVSKDVAEELFGAIRKGMHGDFGLGNDVTGNVVVQQQKPDELISKLERLSVLKEKGMISDKEFEAIKTRPLSEIRTQKHCRISTNIASVVLVDE